MSNTKQAVKVEGLRETLRACNKLGRDANRELRNAARDIATATAREARAEGMGMSALQRLAASSVRSGSDRVPKILSGGGARVGHKRTPVGSIFFGAEFGGGAKVTTRQFPRHRGQAGYFLWPTIRKRKNRDLALYQRALDRVCERWARE